MKRRLIHIITIFLLIIVLLIDVVKAASLSVFMTPSTSNVQTSSEVVVKVKVANLDFGDKGINTFSATLNYDSDVFEEVLEEDVSGLNNWTVSYTPDSGKITLFKTNFVNSDEELFQIKLKTKSNVTKSSGTVSLKSISASNDDDETTATEVSTSITIGSGIVITPGNTTSNNTTNNTTTNKVNTANNNAIITINNKVNNTISNYSNTNSSISNKINNTTSTENSMSNYNTNNNKSTTNEVVPYTGTRENVRIALIVLLVVAGYIYIKFEKLNKVC